MEIQVREARKEDAQQMLTLYNSFAQQFVGLSSRDIRNYRRLLRRKERINWVAINKQGKMVGYASSRFDKGRREGRVEEIIVDSRHDFEKVAKPLVDKAYNTLIEKKPALIIAGSIRNPQHEKVLPALGFISFESTGVFMYSILNTQRFLNELAPVFANRLKRMERWRGLAQIECEGHSLFLQKTSEEIQQFVWTNQPIDFKVKLNKTVLTKLIFGIANPIGCFKNRELEVEATLGKEITSQLLGILFPQKQFLITDYW